MSSLDPASSRATQRGYPIQRNDGAYCCTPTNKSRNIPARKWFFGGAERDLNREALVSEAKVECGASPPKFFRYPIDTHLGPALEFSQLQFWGCPQRHDTSHPIRHIQRANLASTVEVKRHGTKSLDE